MKKVLTFFLLFGIGEIAVAQDAATSFWDDPVNNPMTPFYMVVALVFLVTIILLYTAIYLLSVLNLFVQQQEEEKAAKLGVPYARRPSLWQRMKSRLTRAVPVEREETVLLDHDYDGIKELDNHLPPWWKWLFYTTIIWGVVYLVAYHVTHSFPLSHEEYDHEVAAAREKVKAYRASQPQEAIDENGLTYSADPEIIKRGQAVFSINCTPCHAKDGGGGIGPNLTDNYWLHGGELKQIFHTVTNGVVDKGMIAWGNVLTPQQIRDVSYYVVSIRGSKPANPKAPQGELMAPAPAATDSTAVNAAM